MDSPPSTPPHLGRSGWAGLALSVLVSAGILAALIHMSELSFAALRDVWGRVDGALLVVLVVLSVLCHVLMGTDRMRRVFAEMGVKLSIGEALALRVGGDPLRFLLPAQSGLVLDAMYFWRYRGVPLDRTSGTLAFDVGLNFAGTVIWLAVGTLALGGGPWWLAPWAAAALVALLGVFLVSGLHDLCVKVTARVHHRLERVARGVLAPFREMPLSRRIFFLGYGVIFQARWPAACYLLFSAAALEPGPAEVVTYTCLALVAGQVPITFHGIGARETVFATAFSHLAPASTLVTLGLALTIIMQAIPMLAGAPLVPWYLSRIARRGQASV